MIELKTMINELGLSSQHYLCSLRMYEQLKSAKLTIGRDLDQVTAAIIYLTCIELNYPLSIKQLSVKKKDLFRQVKFIRKHLGIRVKKDLVNYINKYGSDLKMSPQVITKAIKNLRIVEEQIPNSTALMKTAVCLYLTGETSIRQLSFVSKSGLSKTLRKLK